ncbi:MAG TPA: hypothetical protein VGE34_00060 [Candidatus Saccharimonadales bacterium]
MERIIRITIVFGISFLVGLLSILSANGNLTWKSAGMVGAIVLIVGFIVSVWAVVHYQFPVVVEMGIVAMAVIGVVVMLFAGGELRDGLKTVFDGSSSWWLAWPLVGGTLLSVLFERGRR